MAKRRAKRTISPSSRFDGEAIGLVLFAVGIFMGVTVLLPPTAPGFMADTHELLSDWGGWAAYLLFLPPVSYGVLVFLGRDLRNLTRRLAGGTLVVLSLLCLHDLFRPEEAGLLASSAMAPLLGAVSYFAVVLPLLTLTLGVELFLAWPRLTIAKGFFRGLSMTLAGGLLLARDALESRSAGREQVRDRTSARNLLLAHQRDLQALDALYPQSRELEEWKRETKDALRTLGRLDEDGLKRLLGELNAWRDLLREFVSKSAQSLRAAVLAEAPEAGAEVEAVAQDVRKNRHELSAELGAAMASGALEGVRRVLVMDIMRLASRAAALEKDRKRAEKVLEKADTDVLARELPKHHGRVKEWTELGERFAEWQARAAAFPGWPELAVRYDQAPADVTSALAAALQQEPDVTLQERERWEARLNEPGEARAAGVPPREAVVAPAAAPVAALVPPEVPTPEAPVPTATLLKDQDTEAGGVAPAAALIDLDFTGLEPAPEDEQALAVPAVLSAGAAKVAALADAVLAETTAATVSAAPVPALPVPVSVGAAPGAIPAARLGDTGGYVPRDAIRTETVPWEDDEDEDVTPARASAVIPAQGAIDMQLPSLGLLDPVPRTALDTSALDAMAHSRAGLINETLTSFGLQARVVDHARGPTVTRYEIEPAPGEKISRIASLANDLARALAVGGVRVEAPVPGKSVIGLEVPNAEREPVTFHTAAVGPAFRSPKAKLPIILGKSIDGEMVVGDLARMPHLLIAGSTGSGKSVCVNTLICSLLFRYLPTELRFLMVDPKMVELTPYDGIPHLVREVVTNPADAAGVLLGAVAHMERRYKMMSQVGAKNLEQFNAKMRQVNEPELPHLVIIIDELADLMITSPKEVESAIMRLAQMARATGMHLVLATQRPSVDILTSLIKVNVPARVAFAVSSSHDSRTILDAVGAERLTGMGDMLFYQPGLVKPLRLQGPYISETETTRVTDFLKRQVFEDWFGETYGMDFEGVLDSGNVKGSGANGNMDFSDPYLRSAAEICIEEGQGSVSRLQRRLSVGHARAGKLMDMLEAMGIVSKHQGSKPREVLITRDDLPEYFGK